MTNLTPDFVQMLQQIAANPELADALRTILFPNGAQATDAPVAAQSAADTSNTGNEPCPKIDDITLLQATLFDNGEDGHREKYEPRFKMTLEIWTDDADDIRLSEWNWKRSVTIRNRSDFEKQIKRLAKHNSISDFYYTILKNVCEGVSDQSWFGLLGDKGSKNGKKGTNYYDGQFIIVDMDESGRPIKLILVDKTETLHVSNFSEHDMKGNPLKGKAKAQARLDRCNYRKDWGTN